MSLQTPVPPLFIADMQAMLGVEEAARLEAALETAPAVSVRLNPRKPILSDPFADMETEPVPWCAYGVRLHSRPLFTLMPEMHGGAFYVQEESSMIHSHIISQIHGGRPARVLDLCAAPGGKTGAMLGALPAGSVVVANEYARPRATVLAENIAKLGYPDVIVTSGDAALWGVASQQFDIIAADAPCSGEGMMRKEDVARSQWSRSLTESCAVMQRDILTGALPALKTGGYLIYSTCTFNRREDEDIAEWLISEHGLEPVEIMADPSWGIRQGLSDTAPALRFMPHLTRGEGLFAAVFRKTAASPGETIPASGRNRNAKNRRGGANAPARQGVNPAECHGWLRDPESMMWRSDACGVTAISPDAETLRLSVPEGIKVLSAGLRVATVKGNDMVPSPELALSTILHPGAFTEVELTRDDALRFLRRESFPLPAETPRGYVLVSHNGVALGWMKNLVNRANNLWPAPWRIRLGNKQLFDNASGICHES